jgi:hypothetical protein
MRGFTACAVRPCGSDITRQFNFDKAIVMITQTEISWFICVIRVISGSDRKNLTHSPADSILRNNQQNEKILFPTGSAHLSPEEENRLRELIQENPMFIENAVSLSRKSPSPGGGGSGRGRNNTLKSNAVYTLPLPLPEGGES